MIISKMQTVDSVKSNFYLCFLEISPKLGMQRLDFLHGENQLHPYLGSRAEIQGTETSGSPQKTQAGSSQEPPLTQRSARTGAR